jgi:hypothetical protein
MAMIVGVRRHRPGSFRTPAAWQAVSRAGDAGTISAIGDTTWNSAIWQYPLPEYTLTALL